MVNGQKHSSKLNDSTFTIFIDPCADNSGWKSLSELYAVSYDCLLTHWLLITSIFFLTETTYSNIFRCTYHSYEKYFLSFLFNFFFLHFRNLGSILNIFRKTMSLMYLYLYFSLKCIFELTDSEKRA